MATPNFSGMRVAAFESRRCAEMARMIEKLGGVPLVSPSMREVSVDDNPAAVDFANRLITGQVDVVIFMTGVGVKYLVDHIQRHIDRDRFLSSLADISTVARGPKPTAALKQLGFEPTCRVPEPNTWREVLTTVDRELAIANQVVAIQEYGLSNPSLIAGLEARGATVESLKVYDWELPEDLAPLEANVRAIADGQVDVVLFTSSHQVTNLLRVAEQLGLADTLRSGLHTSVVASIGPTTSETLRRRDLPVDLEPDRSKMGNLVSAAAADAMPLSQRKTWITAALAEAPAAAVDSQPYDDGPFMRACRLQPTDTTPVWLMRQAGRYMPEYRNIRDRTTFLELCKNPQWCSEIMLTAVDRLGVDAAIIFSDLLPILEPMGLELEFAKGEGPIIHNPVREAADVDRVVELESVESMHFVMETVRQTRADLPSNIPLIGFAGAPFTLASYAIEGGSSRSYLHTKTLMYRDEGAWDALMSRLVRSVTRYLNAQVAAGAQAVQLFDSWVGCLSVDDYRRYAMPYVNTIVAGIAPGVPVINFATGNPALLPLLRESGASVIGIDWRVRLDDAWSTVGYDRAVQGNLDPLVLLADRQQIRRRAGEVLKQASGRPGHIFNLGHGVIPQTPVDNAIALVEAVHELSAER